jgi:pimeloyl-ACP methyl ester carboxylesterase
LSLLKQASLIGSFIGSFLAIEYAMKFPSKVNKLVLVSPVEIMRTSTQFVGEYIVAALYPLLMATSIEQAIPSAV